MRKKFVISAIVLGLVTGAFIGGSAYLLFANKVPSLSGKMYEMTNEEDETGSERSVKTIENTYSDFSVGMTKEEKPETEEQSKKEETREERPEEEGDGEAENDGEENKEEGETSSEDQTEEEGEASSEEEKSDYLCAFSSERKLKESDLDRIEKELEEELPDGKSLARMLINELYAKHGYSFRNKKIQKFFEKKDWYRKIEKKTQNMDKVFAKMNRTEKDNLNFLMEHDGEN